MKVRVYYFQGLEFIRRAQDPEGDSLMKAEVISIGTELLLGEIQDTNASYIASRLPALGIDLYYVHVVGDNIERLTEVYQRASARADLVISTGGLGPTEDDVTRDAIAALVKEKAELEPALERELRSYFAGRGTAMPQNNLRQATLIPSAQAIPNKRGTAPGWWVEKNGKIIVAMPGPPHEMQEMWEYEVMPRLRGRVSGSVLVTRVLKITGTAESAVDEMCGDLLRGRSPTIGVYAKPDGIHLRLGAKASNEGAGYEIIAPVEQKLRKIFGNSLWGTDGETLEGHVGQKLLERGLSLATMESCTGGLLASRITDAPGSSAYFKGGFVTYTNEAKTQYGVDPRLIQAHGAVSPQVAAAMAKAARLQLNADLGIGVTGVAGPDEQEGKPVGTVFVSVDHASGNLGSANQSRLGRADIKMRAANTALFQLRQVVLGLAQFEEERGRRRA